MIPLLVGLLAVGQCFVAEVPRERWEKPVLTQVTEVGRDAYRVRYWSPEHHKFLGDYSEPIQFVRGITPPRKVVECPK